jgi:hypothetical protein
VGYQCSVTAGTIFHKTRTPLSSWFWAIYRMSHDKKGLSAVQLSKEIGVNYETAWLMQHKIRKAMEDRDQNLTLSGLIEADEGYVGGHRAGQQRTRHQNQSRGGSCSWTQSRCRVQRCGQPRDALEGTGTMEEASRISWAGMKKELTQATVNHMQIANRGSLAQGAKISLSWVRRRCD